MRAANKNRTVSLGVMPRVQGGQPIEKCPKLSTAEIQSTFDETLEIAPRITAETCEKIVQYHYHSDPRSDTPQSREVELPLPTTELTGELTEKPNRLTYSREFAQKTNNSYKAEYLNRTTQNPASAYDQRENNGALQLVAIDLFKSYKKGKLNVPVLNGVNLGVRQGELLAIVGQSGSGKSTLLHLLATLDAPDSGSIHFDGQRIDSLSSGQRDLLRNRFIGMIFQFYHLIPEMTTLENVLSPIMIRESVWGYMTRRSVYKKQATELLERVGLAHRLHHKPNELSGGEMQRAAIARALIARPQILLADEPTGNLDSKSAKEVLELLHALNQEEKVTIVMVTHDLSIAEQAGRTIRLVDGKVVR